ncbi:MAG: class I SAM-dependent methyltransferase [Isosphaeraceae bacterium]|nr:class I SAM-dependent methyltransferase [Isosphaeraceae bacterium]
MNAPTQEAYDQLAPIYDRRWAYYTEATLRATLDGLDLAGRVRFLDLGAGTGELARRLLGRWPDREIIGVDLSRAMLVQGLAKLALRRWRPVQGDAARLPFPDGVFDALLCTNAFHHFQAPRAALAEMHRVLRPGGLLTLTDWCDDYLTCKLCSLYLHLVDRSFRRAYTLRACRQLLDAAGFTVVSARKFKIDWLWGLMRLEARA